MSFLNLSKACRSAGSRLLALYSSMLVAWGCILMAVLHYEVSGYLGDLSRHSLMQRQHIFERLDGDKLVDSLTSSMIFDVNGVDAYGLFDKKFRPLSGMIRAVPPDLPLDGKIHRLNHFVRSYDTKLPKDIYDAVVFQTEDGPWIVLVRTRCSLFGLNQLIWNSLLWVLSITIITGDQQTKKCTSHVANSIPKPGLFF